MFFFFVYSLCLLDSIGEDEEDQFCLQMNFMLRMAEIDFFPTGSDEIIRSRSIENSKILCCFERPPTDASDRFVSYLFVFIASFKGIA